MWIHTNVLLLFELTLIHPYSDIIHSIFDLFLVTDTVLVCYCTQMQHAHYNIELIKSNAMDT